MNIENFLMQNVEKSETERDVKLGRFKEAFVIQAISETDNAQLRKSATVKRRSKSGQVVADTDTDKYVDGLVTRCVKVPDLHNAQLQESYGTAGDAPGTLKAMLLAGEYADLVKAIQELNGFNDEDPESLKDEVKN